MRTEVTGVSQKMTGGGCWILPESNIISPVLRALSSKLLLPHQDTKRSVSQVLHNLQLYGSDFAGIISENAICNATAIKYLSSQYFLRSKKCVIESDYILQ
ncbi:hypothetical protein XENOCAPTIV_008289 [Xenoophorus captivus]|uniref:Uncharacterized protein n=1 Tax=Xenoophorus captivus TaxID=1517983 RepID=A0ABV0Q8R6_9TELE